MFGLDFSHFIPPQLFLDTLFPFLFPFFYNLFCCPLHRIVAFSLAFDLMSLLPLSFFPCSVIAKYNS